jgi:ADP-heptose:LPS heptosyltransferase
VANGNPQSAIRNLIVPAVAGIGNALMAVPLVRQLKRGLPKQRLVVVAGNGAIGDVFSRLPEVDEVVVAKKPWRMIRETRRRKPSHYVVPFPSNRWEYNALQFVSGAKTRLLHAYPLGKFKALAVLPAQRINAERGVHDVIQNLRLLEPLGIKPDFADKPVFPLSVDDHAGAARLLNPVRLGRGHEFIVMHAGSAQTVLAQAKRWPPGRYGMLLQAIHRTLKLPVVLVEGPDETGVATEILSHAPPEKIDARVVKLTGPLGEAGALLSYARAYVGSDSGLAHLSAAVGTPPVTLFAPSDPDRVSPFGYRALVVQVQKMCSPCFLYPWESCKPKMKCSAPFCIEEIGIEPVMHKLKSALTDPSVSKKA